MSSSDKTENPCQSSKDTEETLKSTDEDEDDDSDSSEDSLDHKIGAYSIHCTPRDISLIEAESIINDVEVQVPEHLKNAIVARAHDAFSEAKCGGNPTKAICTAMKQLNCMGKTSDPCTKMKLLACALEKIKGCEGSGFLKQLQIDLNPCATDKQKKKAQKAKKKKTKCKVKI